MLNVGICQETKGLSMVVINGLHIRAVLVNAKMHAGFNGRLKVAVPGAAVKINDTYIFDCHFKVGSAGRCIAMAS